MSALSGPQRPDFPGAAAGRPDRQWRRALKWLRPGMLVKRYLALLLAGVTVLALGIAYLLIDIYQSSQLPAAVQPLAEVITFQSIPQLGRALLFGVVGSALAVAGLIGLNRSLLGAVGSQDPDELVELVDRRRLMRSGPKIVAIGGGTGLSTLLRGLKEQTSNITAIITVADDGGSSGRLRRSLGVHPPGDFRQCIAALADTEPLMESLFEYRFGDGELGGHAFGNLFIVAMSGITGSFEGALNASSRVLKVRGRIVPSTLAHVTLFAELEDARIMAGESRVPEGRAPIRRVFLEPADPPAHHEAVSAILDADLVILGPGSLYTSVIPNLLVPDIVHALEVTSAPIVYAANVATQPGETDGYDLTRHVLALRRHLGPAGARIGTALANDNQGPEYPARWQVDPVRAELSPDLVDPPRLVAGDLVDVLRPTRHDPLKLAAAVMGLVNRKLPGNGFGQGV